ncbi:MAG: ATP-grasp domain-containing protein [Synergistota bacterium]|nr:ATP-grasp domain-containing protein [Synergistota bacterium]
MTGGEILVYGGGVDNRPDLVRTLARGRLLAGNDPSVLAEARNIKTLRTICMEENIPFPMTWLSGEENQAGPFQGGPTESSGLLKKKALSAAGTGVSHYRGGSLPTGEYLQEFLEGTPCSISFIAHKQGVCVMGLSEQITGWSPLGGSGFSWNGNITPLSAAKDGSHIYQKASRYARVLSRRFGLVGFNCVDMMLEPDGALKVLEINPRYSGSMELLGQCLGKEPFLLHIAASMGGTLPDVDVETASSDRCCAKGVVYAKRDCVAPDTVSWFSRGRRDIPWKGDVFSPGEPVCTVYASGRTRDTCLEALGAEAEKVYSELAGF